jgi:hypothetical protein
MIRAAMAQLQQNQYLSPDELTELQELKKKLTDLHIKRAPLVEKIRQRKHSDDDKAEIDKLNRAINQVTAKIKKLEDKNPLLGKNRV